MRAATPIVLTPEPDLRVEVVHDGVPDVPIAELEQTLRRVARDLQLKPGTICLRLTDDGGIRDLNRRYRGIDAATDVLTFPAAELPGVMGPDRPIGDIVISLDTARTQAERRGVALRDELAHLCVHGALHLAGFDDEDEGDRAAMIAAQNELVTRYGFTAEPNWCSLYGVVQP
ncbi:MAG: rRNA maturation RNase YbeY [Fimbriimonadaceae bacterium]|nr:rRNA maturation RNase YbeY [Fimbriimonadaceae bacterium]